MRSQFLLSLVAIGLLASIPINAADVPIARVPVQENPSDPEVKAVLDAIRARGNRPINLNLVSALSPNLAKARSALASAIRYQSVVPRPQRELIIVRTAQLMGGEYELNQHLPAARSCGYTQEQINALEHWQSSNQFGDKDRALLAYVDAIVRTKVDVDDRTFAELARFFNPR